MPHRSRLPATRSAHVRPLLTALAIASGSLSAHALTLGRLQVLSGVGEPLRAEVEIAETTAAESQDLKAQLGSPRSFQQAGMEFNPALEGVSVNVEKRSNGRSFIVLQGRKPVQESFIDLILEAQWATDRQVRNYALLLNSVADKPQPAGTASPLPAASPQAPLPTPALQTLPLQTAPVAAVDETPPRIEYNAQNVPVYRFEPVVDAPKPLPSQARPVPMVTEAKPTPMPAVQADAATTPGQTVTVQAGQTASQLARAHMSGPVSLEQMLVAMQRQNPQAFIQDNVNLLRAGAVLRMPTVGQALQIPAAEARQLVIAHHREFASHAQRIAQRPLQVAKQATRESAGKVSGDTPSAPPAAPVQDTLTLSKPQIGKDSAEVQVAAEREAKDAADQVASLKKNIEELNSLATATPAASDPASTDGPRPGNAVWMWAAGFAALLGLWLWRRNRKSPGPETFAPSYEDIPMTAGPAPAADSPAAIPPEMASIDLNLPSPAAGDSVPTDAPVEAEKETEESKLALAHVLLSKGDTEIARSLVQSVIHTGSGDLKARAQQMLSRFP